MRKLETKNCETCKAEFQQGYNVSVNKWATMRFCSLSCRRHSDETKLQMSVDTKNHPATKHGEEHHNWKGGVVKAHNKLRNSSAYNKWRKLVYQKDRWTCQECGLHCQKGNIIAHHIKRFADYVELRFDVDNGMVLCRSCHAIIENPNIVHV